MTRRTRTTAKKPRAPKPATRPRPRPATPARRSWVMPLAVGGVLAAVLAGTVWLIRAVATSPTGNPLAGDPGIAHVHGLGVDPADGTLYAATHYGLFRIPGTGPATRVADRYQDTMGFTVVGPGHFLGSGHPDLREDKPSQLGLIESTDAGATWTDLSLSGQADFHALEAVHGKVYGYDASTGRFMVTDNRVEWDTRATLPMADFSVSPDNPDLILATIEQGLARSSDGGRTFALVGNAAPPLLLVSWPSSDALYGVTLAGAVLASSDGGQTWQQRGSLDGSPEALTAVDARTVHAATDTGIYTSTDGGRSFTLRYKGEG